MPSTTGKLTNARRSSIHEDEVNRHINAYGHWTPTFGCEACNTKFHTQQQARTHMDNNNHWRLNWCNPCKRGLQNANNLMMHLNGSAHQAGSIACPFCKRPHTTASGVVHHVETCACPRAPQVNREVIFKMINQRDTNGVITNKQIAWHGEENSESIATGASWNGYGCQCGLCSKSYSSLRSLNQHLSSPAHEQNIYHCPGRGCAKQFKSLAPLVNHMEINHMESESCGVMKFK